MSDLDKYLTTCELLDCQGRARHTLTLLVDGRIRVRHVAGQYTIDPGSGLVDPPQHVPEQVLNAAANLIGRAIPRSPHGH